ncbi:uncharacterized protein CTHT_0039250 [Thermochaetoides thermophila DSM 1495]|uniref:Uncharacterized protein n=1 Tax=Chaetomium thermophilum (strain DSM 1495 / CBS 144.50 / IMI 039719) TaxID=759272 RepID=G0S3X8_CHATD|nr:hypothetical protein CTHT_0039250 [Thermochaetoides thermophila DSM 1495]EGS22040.1 hypothetical protein CTHT_0039250 [Thermochaetoides thermophila DSM 1495]
MPESKDKITQESLSYKADFRDLNGTGFQIGQNFGVINLNPPAAMNNIGSSAVNNTNPLAANNTGSTAADNTGSSAANTTGFPGIIPNIQSIFQPGSIQNTGSGNIIGYVQWQTFNNYYQAGLSKP